MSLNVRSGLGQIPTFVFVTSVASLALAPISANVSTAHNTSVTVGNVPGLSVGVINPTANKNLVVRVLNVPGRALAAIIADPNFATRVFATRPGLPIGGNGRVHAVVGTSPALPLGVLAVDGPATPEQLALILPVTGSLTQAATATCRYKLTAGSTWNVGHPLYRIRPDLTAALTVPGSISDAFAWPVIDLVPGASYDVEVTVSDGTTTLVKTLTASTRALPATAGSPNKTATTANVATVLAGANPGDVIELQPGTYSSLTFNRSGTLAQPIYIRGQSRTGVIISSSGYVVTLQQASHVVFENFTIQGSGTDSGTAASCKAFEQSSNGYNSQNITIRNITASGIDSFVYFFGLSTGTLVYNCTVVGNNLWQTSPVDYLGTNLTWNDDCIHIPGSGNCGFQNTLSRFGDCFGPVTTGETYCYSHFYYRNDVRDNCDDFVEFDEAIRNLAFYDNRGHNMTTASSLDYLFGGPLLYARNVCINLGSSQMHKWNSDCTGHFFYNNTFIATVKAYRANPTLAQWYQPTNAQVRSYGYRNNIHIGPAGTSWMLRDENLVHDPVDRTHNSWFPDLQSQWISQSYSSLANMQSGVPNKTPVFASLYSPSNRPFAQDSVTVAQPFTTTITLPATSATAVSATYTPIPSHASLRNTGVAIPNVTDGFTGAAPDRGALVTGRALPLWGDQSGTPAYIASMTAFQTKRHTSVVNGKTTIRGAMPSEWLTNDPAGPADTSRVDRIIRAYSGGAKGFGPKLYVNGAGHNDGANNALCTFDFSGGTMPQGWTVFVSPVSAFQASPARFYSDGKWGACHTYDGICYASHNGMIYRFGGSFALSGDQKPYCYKLDPNAGTNPVQLPDMQFPQFGYGTFYDPTTHKIFVWNLRTSQGQFFRCDNDTLSNPVNMGLAIDECSGAWDHTRGRGIVIDGGGSSLVTINFAGESVSVSRISFTGSTAIVSINDVSVVYDPVRDCYWAFGGGGGQSSWATLYEIPAAGPTWPITAHTLTGDGAIPALSSQIGSYGRLVIDWNWRHIGTVGDVDAPAVSIRLP